MNESIQRTRKSSCVNARGIPPAGGPVILVEVVNKEKIVSVCNYLFFTWTPPGGVPDPPGRRGTRPPRGGYLTPPGGGTWTPRGGTWPPPPCGQTDGWMEGQTLIKTLPSLVLRTRAVKRHPYHMWHITLLLDSSGSSFLCGGDKEIRDRTGVIVHFGQIRSGRCQTDMTQLECPSSCFGGHGRTSVLFSEPPCNCPLMS